MGTTEGPSKKKATRGKKSKLKKRNKKYADQDEEDRSLALLALQGAPRPEPKQHQQQQQTTSQVQAAADTAALLIKDSSFVANQLPHEVKLELKDCLMKKEDVITDAVWNHLDPNVLQHLLDLNPIDAQLGAVSRLSHILKHKEVDNISSSLSGIIRTIKKYGYQDLEDETLAKVKDLNKEEFIEDSAELAKFTGKPVEEDLINYAILVCGPYQSVSKYKYKIKLLPGPLKRGKASKQCLDFFLKDKSNTKTTNFIKQITQEE